MGSPAVPFKTAQEEALRTSEALRAAMGGVVRLYTEVPENAPLPYIVVGDDEIHSDTSDCGEEHEIVSTVRWWAKAIDGEPGSLVVRRMGGIIVTLLLRPLPIAGHATDIWDMEVPETYGTDPDQSSRGRVAFRYETTALD